MAAHRRVYDMRVCRCGFWWEVVAAHHRVHDYACCHLQADCLESGISSGPYARLRVWKTFTFYLLSHLLIDFAVMFRCSLPAGEQTDDERGIRREG